MHKKTEITSAQIRAARALLNWSARQLSQYSGVSLSTIQRAEGAEAVPGVHEQTLAAIKASFERSGIEFLELTGVRFARANGRSRGPCGNPRLNICR
jgi:transcriptional regulator with XRE-family HTH domain